MKKHFFLKILTIIYFFIILPGCSASIHVKASVKLTSQKKIQPKPSPRKVVVKFGIGGGTLISKGDGRCYILTAYHIEHYVGLPQNIMIGGREMRVSIWKKFPGTDIAILKTEKECSYKAFLSIKSIRMPKKGEVGTIFGVPVYRLVGPLKRVNITYTGRKQGNFLLWDDAGVTRGFSGYSAFSQEGEFLGFFSFIRGHGRWLPSNSVGLYTSPKAVKPRLKKLGFK